jgi:hypothetical protein
MDGLLIYGRRTIKDTGKQGTPDANSPEYGRGTVLVTVHQTPQHEYTTCDGFS